MIGAFWSISHLMQLWGEGTGVTCKYVLLFDQINVAA